MTDADTGSTPWEAAGSPEQIAEVVDEGGDPVGGRAGPARPSDRARQVADRVGQQPERQDRYRGPGGRRRGAWCYGGCTRDPEQAQGSEHRVERFDLGRCQQIVAKGTDEGADRRRSRRGEHSRGDSGELAGGRGRVERDPARHPLRGGPQREGHSRLRPEGDVQAGRGRGAGRGEGDGAGGPAAGVDGRGHGEDRSARESDIGGADRQGRRRGAEVEGDGERPHRGLDGGGGPGEAEEAAQRIGGRGACRRGGQGLGEGIVRIDQELLQRVERQPEPRCGDGGVGQAGGRQQVGERGDGAARREGGERGREPAGEHPGFRSEGVPAGPDHPGVAGDAEGAAFEEGEGGPGLPLDRCEVGPDAESGPAQRWGAENPGSRCGPLRAARQPPVGPVDLEVELEGAWGRALTRREGQAAEIEVGGEIQGDPGRVVGRSRRREGDMDAQARPQRRRDRSVQARLEPGQPGLDQPPEATGERHGVERAAHRPHRHRRRGQAGRWAEVDGGIVGRIEQLTEQADHGLGQPQVRAVAR